MAWYLVWLTEYYPLIPKKVVARLMQRIIGNMTSFPKTDISRPEVHEVSIGTLYQQHLTPLRYMIILTSNPISRYHVSNTNEISVRHSGSS
jgi:hypothetical protein